jgi:hypothetical protein
MASHPINLAARFLLELAALVALGIWGWTQHAAVWRFVWASGLVLLATAVWGIFAVPDDPSRSGKAPVPVPGLLRLLLELAIFAAAVWAFVASDWNQAGVTLAILVLIHYAISYDRILWLLRR